MDSLLLSLCGGYRVRDSNEPVEGSAFGYCASRRQFYFRFCSPLLTTFEP
jgi:hypothetical protein